MWYHPIHCRTLRIVTTILVTVVGDMFEMWPTSCGRPTFNNTIEHQHPEEVTNTTETIGIYRYIYRYMPMIHG